MRPQPHPAALAWVAAQPRATLYTTGINQTEILYAPESRSATASAACLPPPARSSCRTTGLRRPGVSLGEQSPSRRADRQVRRARGREAYTCGDMARLTNRFAMLAPHHPDSGDDG